MSVDTVTGEIIDRPSYGEVRASVTVAKTHLEKAAEAIVWQIENRAWEVLGHDSWDAMREAEYGGAAFMVPRAERPELMARMRRAGLTHRELGSTAGVSEDTVQRDLKAADAVLTEIAITNSRGQRRPASYARRIGEDNSDPVGLGGKTYRPVDHEARARVAVERYPDLSWQFEQRDFEHCWRTADKLDEFAERGQLEERLENLRRYNAIEKAKQDGTYVPPAAPAAVSEEERRRRQEEQDRLDWHKRAAHYLASFMATYSLATGLRNNPERDLILAQLDAKGRERFLQLESEHPEWIS